MGLQHRLKGGTLTESVFIKMGPMRELVNLLDWDKVSLRFPYYFKNGSSMADYVSSLVHFIRTRLAVFTFL